MHTRPLRSIYQLKVSLKGSMPPIWRRLHMVSSDSLDDLHVALQVAMGWADAHLHEFVQGQEHYGAIEEYTHPDILDEMDYRLQQVLKKEKDTLHYVYDFGDSWEHEILLEKILPFVPGTNLPVCVEGSRACPPEDIGGLYGYDMFLETIADPSHPEHDEMLEWVGGDFDAEHFDLAEVNYLLQEYCHA